MDLETRYRNMWDHSLQKFKTGVFESDPLIDDTHDTRYGLTLRLQPSEQFRSNIISVLEDLRQAAPGQYFYPVSDMHITVLTIISAYSDFRLQSISTSDYQELISEVLGDISPFRIEFRGITASPSAIMVQGFPQSGELNRIRNKLRREFRESGLPHSIDKRYEIQTAHMTCLRFRKEPENPDLLIKVLRTLKDFRFGSCTISELELVSNDWYHRKEKVKKLQTFRLG